MREEKATMKSPKYQNVSFALFQTVFAQLSAGGVALPFSFKSVDDLLEPLVQHACKLVGLK